MVIYEPSGKAREYSPLALNVYDGCIHGCKYCYAPGCRRVSNEKFFGTLPTPRNNIVSLVSSQLIKEHITKQVLLSFIGDPYGPSTDNNVATSNIVTMFRNTGTPYAVLTKAANRCLVNIDVFKKSKCMIGATLTFMDENKSKSMEPMAALPEARLQTLKILHDNKVRTFVSFEPVLDPKESLALIERTLNDDSVDVYKIGKINNFQGLDKTIDWVDFTKKALTLLRPSGKEIYIKNDLAEQCRGKIEFSLSERNSDMHTA